MSKSREELIARHCDLYRSYENMGCNGSIAQMFKATADMLKADAERIAGYKEDQRELMSQMQEMQQEINELKAKQVQPIKPIPESFIYEILNRYYRLPGPVEFVRAIEEYHGIKGENS